MQPAGDFFQPCREIDGRPDAGEVEPVAAADIAVQNFSDMQRDAEAKTLDGFADRVVHGVDVGAGLARGFQNVGADLLGIADRFRDRKHRQQPVAHELQDFAAMGPDRRHLAVEIVIENIDHGLGRQPVRQRGKAAQIRQPDRRMHGIGVAAPDLAAQNPLAGAVADIGVEQDRRGAAQADDLDQPGQRRYQRSQTVELFVAEAARLLGGPARSREPSHR